MEIEDGKLMCELDDLYAIYMDYVAQIGKHLNEEEMEAFLAPVLHVWEKKGQICTKGEIIEYFKQRRENSLRISVEALYKKIKGIGVDEFNKDEIRSDRWGLIKEFLLSETLYFPDEIMPEDRAEYLQKLLSEVDFNHKKILGINWDDKDNPNI